MVLFDLLQGLKITGAVLAPNINIEMDCKIWHGNFNLNTPVKYICEKFN